MLTLILMILFLLSKTQKLYVSVVTLSAKGNQKLSKRLSAGFERSIYWNEFKTKSENKNTTNEYRYFLESNLVEVNRLFWFIQIMVRMQRDIEPEGVFLPKGVIKKRLQKSERIFMTSQLVLI